jgi:polyribonucleotide nucleotidyltransferase
MQDFTEVFKVDPNSPSGVSWKITVSNKKSGDFAGYFDKAKKDFIITYKGEEYSASVILTAIGGKDDSKQRTNVFTHNFDGNSDPNNPPDGFKESQILKGVVTRVTDYGLFVKVNGRIGLLHIREMIFCANKHPSKLFYIGQELFVKVLEVEKEPKST